MTRTPPGTLPEPAVPEPAVPERSARVASIVGATRAILVEQGWEAVSMRTIAAALGITAPSLYKHVKNKDALAALLITDGLLAKGGEGLVDGGIEQVGNGDQHDPPSAQKL